MDFKGKAILITGASTGIGRELALQLAKKGAHVVALARSKKNLDTLSKLDPLIKTIQTDVTNPISVKAAVIKAMALLGKIDVLVNNAGVGYYGPVETVDLKDLDRLIKTNVYGVIAMTQAALPFLKKSKGMIVNISSGLTKMNLPFVAPYASTKFMLNAFTNAMRVELRKYGIKVVSYLPPMVDTPFYTSTIIGKETQRANMSSMKMATPQWTAGRIINAIKAGKREASEAGLAGFMSLHFPALMDNIFYKVMVAPKK